MQTSAQTPAILHLSYGHMGDPVSKIMPKVEKLRAKSPGLTVIIWTPELCEQLFQESYPKYYDTYKGFKYNIQRSDFSRYAALHRYGGAYADLDYKFRRPVGEVLQHIDRTFPQYGVLLNGTPNSFMKYNVSNCLMVARAPGHPFWTFFMDAIRRRPQGKGLSRHRKVMTSTGCMNLAKVYRKFPAVDVGVLPTADFNPLSVCDRGEKKARASNVQGYHMNDGTWNSASSKIANFCLCNWRVLLPVVLGLLAIAVVVALTVYFVQRRKCRASLAEACPLR